MKKLATVLAIAVSFFMSSRIADVPEPLPASEAHLHRLWLTDKGATLMLEPAPTSLSFHYSKSMEHYQGTVRTFGDYWEFTILKGWLEEVPGFPQNLQTYPTPIRRNIVRSQKGFIQFQEFTITKQ